ncbi:MAG: PQQ-dependent sugar dehydrogenase [Cyclobacteriaceae bacterium]|nr:PQQ-dependent sugar dehydrogenase [Cyclobacteriaceae bacterium]MDH5247958.1 PQQ-dependent sugar dehydrogenase [Cyclobacteriaceae bacterium]
MGTLKILSLAWVLFLICCDLRTDIQSPTDTIRNDEYELDRAFPNLTFDMPVELTSAEDNTGRIFVIEQRGTIQVFANTDDVKQSAVFLDIESEVSSGGEKGLLGLAFHPEYETNGYFYVNYTRSAPLETVISRFKVSASNPNMADPKSETILLRFNQPYGNHNGGKLAFGNDGFLYISTGDGGSGGDPKNNAQDRSVLLGKILRIDVNNTTGNFAYGIPADNPYAGNKEGYREEIYAYGMRNAWRFSFDRQTGTLWAGDVGQNKIEEVDIIEKGGNYGWRIMEGNECYKTNTCKTDGLKEPIWYYEQGGDTGQSVTGGFVCRDKHLPGLEGKYIYGDYVTGNIWALTHADNKAIKNERIAKVVGGLSAFGEDHEKNLYVLAYSSGKIYKIVSVK